jgi:peptidoglycan/LPS O-acetylase OafA/YrhL
MSVKLGQVDETGKVQEVLKHINALDGVRGVAILLVLFYHLFWSNTHTGNRVIDFIAQLRESCWVGVDLFFALSGFLITGILFDSREDKHYFKNFYFRRVLRIFPLYYGVILAFFLFFHGTLSTEKRPLYLLSVYLQNTPLWWHYMPKTTLVNSVSHLWSLAVEEQFYIVWPLIVFCVRDRRKLLWVTASLAVAALVCRACLLVQQAPFEETYKMTICRADSLLSGALLALMVRGARETVLRYAAPCFWLALAICCVIGWKSGNFDWETNYSINLFGYSVLAIGGAALIAMTLRPGSIASRLMSIGFLRFFGKYSYGIYVFHQIAWTFSAGGVALFLKNYIHSKVLFHILSTVIELGITIPIAVLSFHFFETPFLRLKKYFNYVRPEVSHRIEAAR